MESRHLNLGRHAKEWRRHKEKANYLYVRYADDFVVLCNSPFAQSISNTLNFKLSIESSPQPQTLQDGLLHP